MIGKQIYWHELGNKKELDRIFQIALSFNNLAAHTLKKCSILKQAQGLLS